MRPITDRGVAEKCLRARRLIRQVAREMAEIRAASGNAACYVGCAVEITLTSTLTAEDENLIAPAILRAVTNILDHLPIAYRVRIDTSDLQCYQHSGPERTRHATGPIGLPLRGDPPEA